MSNRAYGQFCGLARALEAVGERWALLLVRDLLVGPRRFSDLRRGLPKIPSNILSARLKELEQFGVIHRRVLPRPAGSVVYELTPRGRDLEPAVLALGRWGARMLGDPRPDEVVTADSLVMALRTTFHPAEAHNLTATYELHVGDIVLHAKIKAGALEAAEGPLPGADLLLEAGPAFKALLARELTPAEALADGSARITGNPALLQRFVEVFYI